MAQMQLPALAHYPKVIAIFKALHADAPLPEDINARIAHVMRMEEMPFTTSVEAAFALKDEAFKGVEYVNVDLRDYDDRRGLTFLCDIKTETGESGDRAKTRPMAIVKAVIAYVAAEMEGVEEQS